MYESQIASSKQASGGQTELAKQSGQVHESLSSQKSFVSHWSGLQSAVDSQSSQVHGSVPEQIPLGVPPMQSEPPSPVAELET
jgi:hypothetical protein